jgi:hypothetical protein
MFHHAARRGLLLAALISCLVPATAGADVRTFNAVAQSDGVAVFKVAGVHPSTVKRARLHAGRRSAPVSATRVRRGATRGHVQVRLPRRLRAAARSAKAGGSRSRLVVSTSCPGGSTSYSQLVRGTAGLIGYWRLDETSGRVACDALGQNPASYTSSVRLGAAGATADGNAAVQLDGLSGAVRAPSKSSLNPTGAFSAEAWVKPASARASQTIVRKEGQYLVRLNQRKLVFRLWAGGRVLEAASPEVLEAGVWQHVAATYDGTVLRVFHRGRAVAAVVASGAVATGSGSLYFGTSLGTYDWLGGTLDDVALYRSALSAQAVSARVALGRDAAPATGTTGGDTTGSDPRTSPEPTPTSPAPGTDACPGGVSWQNGFGGFGGSTWPGGCWRAYDATSPFNTAIPAGAPSWWGSDTVVSWFNRQGSGPLDWPLGGYNGYQAPTYYGKATDPVYTIVRDSSTLHYGRSNIDGVRLHAPAGMKFNRDADSLMSIVDQTTGIEYDFWYVSAIDDAARTITVKWGGQLPVNGSGVMNGEGYAFESGFGTQFGVIRYAELMAGEINHALYLCVPGVKGRVAPAINTGGNFANQAGMPPMGARLQITLTDEQIEGITLDGRPAPWYYKVILRAAKRYGMIVSDEGDSPWGGLRIESGLQYEAMGQENVWKRFAREQNVPVRSGSFGSHPYLRYTDLRDPSGRSVWHSIRVVSPTAHGYSADLL